MTKQFFEPLASEHTQGRAYDFVKEVPAVSKMGPQVIVGPHGYGPRKTVVFVLVFRFHP